MRFLTLQQPWASLVVHGLKHYETRSWSTRYRGPLGIHASKSFPAETLPLCEEEPYRSALSAMGYRSWEQLPTGVILGIVDLVDVSLTDNAQFVLPPGPERSFGDFAPGRYAWKLVKARRLKEPIPYRGALGIWEADVDQEALL